MSKILDNATKHFRSKLDGSLRKLEVPEWEISVYYYPTTPLKDESQIFQLQQDGKAVEALVMSVIMKARDENGKRLFTPADKSVLMNEVDPQILLRIASVVNGADSDSIEDIEKN
jgi:hypothetical protein